MNVNSKARNLFMSLILTIKDKLSRTIKHLTKELKMCRI
jgi:hypothetical protein